MAGPEAAAAALARLPPGGLFLRPLGLLHGAAAAAAIAAGAARPLAGGTAAFTAVAAIGLDPDRRPAEIVLPLAEFAAAVAGRPCAPRALAQLEALSTPRAPWCGLALGRQTVTMGILNVTPDSFSDGGTWCDPEAAVAHGLAMRDAGADIVDVGGESTRPGATPVSPAEEIARVAPVVRGLAASGVVVSIDTRHAAVMEAALDAGARIVNDVSALTGDPDSLAVVARRRPALLLMHMRGEPATMQRAPTYDAVLVEVLQYLESRITACLAAGIAREQIVVDPGIGFGKTVAHNLALIAGIAAFHALGCGIALGVSRKATIARLSRGEPPSARLPGSLAAALFAVGQGVQILRVHDVAETRQALAIWQAAAGS